MKYTFLSHCSVSPLHPVALEAEKEYLDALASCGLASLGSIFDDGDLFRESLAKLLQTGPENIAFVSNTAVGLNFIVTGYPFEPGDRILTYGREYGSNNYPWRIAANRYKLELDILPEVDPLGGLPEGAAWGWSLEDLERMISDRTRLVVLSHVQFINGFAADLARVGEICRARGVDLIIDAAQSLGSLPLYPEEWGISAIAASGWKWLMGPPGSGVFYTSTEFRNKLAHSLGGALMMNDWLDFANFEWRPFEDARRFEYSTLPWGYVRALGQLAQKIFVPQGIDTITSGIFANQQIAIDGLDPTKYRALQFPEENRSGILAVIPKNRNSVDLVAEAKEHGVLLTSYEPYIRFAPHFYNSADEVQGAVELLNRL